MGGAPQGLEQGSSRGTGEQSTKVSAVLGTVVGEEPQAQYAVPSLREGLCVHLCLCVCEFT